MQVNICIHLQFFQHKYLEYISSGGFARVYKAKRREDGSIVALKIPIGTSLFHSRDRTHPSILHPISLTLTAHHRWIWEHIPHI
ncbi:MAG TPA: hypothetical protein EYP03_02030, partial [Aquificae bacterium]|nr:hypothetical protein [Aquificota bacterium]